MEVDIITFATQEGISVQRARELARTGKVPAKREGRSWVIEYEGHSERPNRRPLSAQSQTDLIGYFDTHTLDHVTGYRRNRLAQRVREVRQADNPAALIRCWFAGAPLPTGDGGAAIVRASLKGFDAQVREAVNTVTVWVLTTPDAVANRLRDARTLQRLSPAEVAVRAKIPLEHYVQLEREGSTPGSKFDLFDASEVLEMNLAKYSILQKVA